MTWYGRRCAANPGKPDLVRVRAVIAALELSPVLNTFERGFQ